MSKDSLSRPSFVQRIQRISQTLRTGRPPAPFQVGDMVTTKQLPNEALIVRRVTEVVPSSICASKWAVSTDGGTPCPCCRRAYTPLIELDAGWFDLLMRPEKK